MFDVAAHRRIIEAIHRKDGPFAIWEIRDATQISTSSVVRTLRKLVDLNLVDYSSRGYKGRRYRKSKRWRDSAADVIENFDLARLLRI